jgi:membrane-bound lytic murein transglycosylase D
MVQPGDSLWKISRRYEGLSIEKIKELNNLKSNTIVPGQKLIVG